MPTAAHLSETRDRGNRCAPLAVDSGSTPVSVADSRDPPRCSLSPSPIKGGHGQRYSPPSPFLLHRQGEYYRPLTASKPTVGSAICRFLWHTYSSFLNRATSATGGRPSFSRFSPPIRHGLMSVPLPCSFRTELGAPSPT
jgi:hypothetical protein